MRCWIRKGIGRKHRGSGGDFERGVYGALTNEAERAIRPLVIGCMNWLFSDTSKGAMASVQLYSLVETAKANGQEP